MNRHRGFFMTTGLGLAGGTFRDDYSSSFTGETGTESGGGPGVGFDILLGGGVAKGYLILGGGFEIARMFFTLTDDWNQSFSSGSSEVDNDALSVTGMFFIQSYLASNGFLRLSLGGTGLLLQADDEIDTDPYGGFSVGFHGGADFPISRKFAIGFSTGFRVLNSSYDDGDDGDYAGDFVLFQPSIKLQVVIF
jgi:hypothetical protein